MSALGQIYTAAAKALDALLPGVMPKTEDVATATKSVGDMLQNYMSGLGTYVDKGAHTVQGQRVIVNRIDVENAMSDDWLARQAIMIPAADATRAWLTHKSADTAFIAKLKEAETALCVRERTFEAIWQSRAYGGSGMLFGVTLTDDPNEVREPFDPERTKPGQLRYLRTIDRWRLASSGVIDNNIESPNFDYPETYSISGSTSQVNVHHSRIIRFDGDPIPWQLWIGNQRWYDSVLQSTGTAIKDVTTVTRAIVSLVYEANFDVIKSPTLTTDVASGQREAVQKRWDMAMRLKSWLHAIIISDDEEYETKSRSFAELANILEKLQITASGAVDIPFTRLYGQSPAGLSATGESDLRNHYDKVSSFQETQLRPKLTKLFRVLGLSAVGRIPDDYTFEFNKLWQITPGEQATINGANATADGAYITNGVVKPSTVARKLKDLGAYPITDDEIEDMQEAEDNPPEPTYSPDDFPPPDITPKKEDTQAADGGELFALPKDDAILCAADDALDAFDARIAVCDGWAEQERDELGRFGFGSGERKDHVEARNAFAASAKTKKSLHEKKKRAQVALSKAVEAGHTSHIAAAAMRLHEHSSALAMHNENHAAVKARVKETTRALKEKTKAIPSKAAPTELPGGHSLSGAVTKEHVLAVHTHLPGGVLDHIEKSGTKTVFTDKIVRRDGENASHATGIFTPNVDGGAHQIQVLAVDKSEMARVAMEPRIGRTGTISGTAAGERKQAITMTHEGAHNAMRGLVDHARATQDPKAIALMDQFAKAYDASKAAGKDKAFSRYAHKAPGEYVAEAVAAYHYEPAYLKTADPAAYNAAHAFVKHTGYGKVQT